MENDQHTSNSDLIDRGVSFSLFFQGTSDAVSLTHIEIGHPFLMYSKRPLEGGDDPPESVVPNDFGRSEEGKDANFGTTEWSLTEGHRNELRCIDGVEVGTTEGSQTEGLRNSFRSIDEGGLGRINSDVATSSFNHSSSDRIQRDPRSPSMARDRHTRGGLMTLPTSRYSMLLPYQMPQVRAVLTDIFRSPVRCIVDCTAHVGGDAIHFSNTFPTAKIIAIDNDPEATAILIKNVARRANMNFTILTQSCLDWIDRPGVAYADFYYFDPPWGGPKYYTEKDVKLYLSGVLITDVVNMVFSKKLTPRVLLKVPRNFAYGWFTENVNGTTKLYSIRKHKKNAVAYNLIDIVPKFE